MALVHKHMDRDPLPYPSWVEPILDHSIEDIKDKYGNGWKKNDLRVFLSAPPPCVFSDDEKTAKETITKEEFEKLEKEDKSMPHDWEKCPDEEYTYCFPLLGEYDWDKKKIILYRKNIEKYSERLDGDNSKEYLTKYVYTHELFHALFHHVTEQDPNRKHHYNYIGEIEEAMTEFCTLVFLKDYGNNLFQFAKNEIKKKQKSVGILAAYGFGAYLYDNLKEDEGYDWINKYIERLGNIDEIDLFVYLYKYNVRLGHQRVSKIHLECILTNPGIGLRIGHGSNVDPNGRKAIIDTMQIIANHINSYNNIGSGYNTQRKILTDLFRNTSNGNYTKDAIMLRLTALDSSYSTNASKSYYAIEEMAEEIWNIPGNGNREDNANRFFIEVATGVQTTSNNVHVDNWFNKQFGIQKNGKTGHRKTSLLSKYAYYCLLLDKKSDGFPIYDSLAVASFPFACMILCQNSAQDLKNLVNQFSSESTYIPVSLYINAMKSLCDGLGLTNSTFSNFQKFDILDAYLWRMGKLSNGNLSLLLDKQEYEGVLTALALNEDPALDKTISDYYGRIAANNNDVLNETIVTYNKKKKLFVTNGYPTICDNKACKEKIVEIKNGRYSGNINALVLFSLIEKAQNNPNIFANQPYLDGLYQHWRQYYMH
ncbi:MAG: hypothetical protein PUB29_02050 [Bacteroidales bacterium]|nr:hypothetical protein [Bacteroidales bacterium]